MVFGILVAFGALRLALVLLRAKKTMPRMEFNETARCGVLGAALFVLGFAIWNLDK